MILKTHFADAEIAAIFSDANYVTQLLVVEVALAKAQAQLGLIPSAAAAAIAARTASLHIDAERLRRETGRDGFPIVELVHQMREHLGADAGAYVHWGATTQDLMDTALVLQIRAALATVENLLQSVIKNLAALAGRHRHTLMAGRTHSQQALPITFGYKVANWLAPLLRHRQRLTELQPRLLLVQLGGAAGTLAAMGDKGIQVQAALAEELNLAVLPMPWHTQRDNLAELASWLSLLGGSLAKIAQDVILLAQTEIGEVHESAEPGRGGSSTLPQKENPIMSEFVIAAARTNSALLASMHQALIQEHERGTHGWQMEWLALPQMIEYTAAALQKILFLSEHLTVDENRMRENVGAAGGLMLAEALGFALTPMLGRAEAKRTVADACRIAVAEKRHVVEVLQEKVQAPLDWNRLREEMNYLGATEVFIDRVISAA